MHQNRVTPLGDLIRTPARGTLMGNRGVIHNDKAEIKRPFRNRAWITCLLQFKGRKFTIMAPNRWTQLFFLDEATAYASGHRPCAECRREDFLKFKAHWIKGNPQYGFDIKKRIGEIDDIMHDERIDSAGNKVTFEMKVADIPDGTFVLMEGKSFLFKKAQVFAWTPFGYEEGIAVPSVDVLTVLTPRSVVNAFRTGLTAAVYKR